MNANSFVVGPYWRWKEMGKRKNAALDMFVITSTLPKRLLSPFGLQYDNTIRSILSDTYTIR